MKKWLLRKQSLVPPISENLTSDPQRLGLVVTSTARLINASWMDMSRGTLARQTQVNQELVPSLQLSSQIALESKAIEKLVISMHHTRRMKTLLQPRINQRNLKSKADILADREPVLATVIRRHGYPPLWSRELSFQTLVHIILEQQVSLASANQAMKKLCKALDEVTPQGFLTLSDVKLKAIGFSRQKISYGRALAQQIEGGRLDIDQFTTMDDQAIFDRLCQLKGIGPWTANVFLLTVMLRQDVWPTGDRALAVGTQELLKLEGVPTYPELEIIAERWKPLRSVAARLIWHNYLSLRKRNPQNDS